MKRVLLWLLPIVDVFKLRKILDYYRSIGIKVPLKHAKLGLVERWVGYLPVGFVLGWLIGFWRAALVIFVAFSVVAPVEFLLMKRGVPPWRFFKRGKIERLFEILLHPWRIFKRGKKHAILEVFLLEGYNAIAYYLMGVGFACLVAEVF